MKKWSVNITSLWATTYLKIRKVHIVVAIDVECNKFCQMFFFVKLTHILNIHTCTASDAWEFVEESHFRISCTLYTPVDLESKQRIFIV